MKKKKKKKMNNNRISMGIIDVSDKIIKVETNFNYIEDSQFDLFEDTCNSKIKSIQNKSFSAKIKKDIRVKFPTKETAQGYRDISYNENHFYYEAYAIEKRIFTVKVDQEKIRKSWWAK